MTKTNIIRAQSGFQEKFTRTNVDFCIGGGVVDCGKLQPLYSKVLTPDGWKRMGDLKVGDYVSMPFSEPARILKIYEHKQKDIYNVTTSDGRICECGLEHLWSIRTRKQKEKYLKDKDKSKHLSVLQTKDLIERLNKGKKCYIPVPEAQEFSKKELPIPPYVMGVLLGDGCITESSWKQDTHILFSSQEDDIIQKVYDIVGGTGIYVNKNNYTKKIYTPNARTYREYCDKEGLLTYSYLKHIPNDYLYSSVEDRKQLLYGLMDTDGTVSDKGNFVFSTTSERLKHDFVELCRSIGYVVTVHEDKREKYKYGIGYVIIVSTYDKIFTSEKHLKKYNKWIGKYRRFRKNYDHVYIKSIEKVGVSDARCILVDDPLHLYITDDYITTHNTFAAVMACAEPSSDKNFRALYLRNNLGDARAAGGIMDTFREIYGSSVKIIESGDPHIDFPSGATVDVTHVANQSKDAILRRFKGRQYDLIYFDEGTGFSWETFTTIYTRNRGKGKWTGHVLMTTNPERDHWLRTFLDWYIGEDGFIREDRNGIVRYFYINGETVNDVVWGDSKEEVFDKCRIDIVRKLKKLNGKNDTFKYEDLIMSFTFYLGRMSENKASIGSNSGYAGAVAMAGGRTAQQMLEGNWNVSTKGDLDNPISHEMAEYVFDNDPQVNGDKWITADLADYGTDNFIAIVWDGFHVIDMLIIGSSTPRQNAENLRMLSLKHDIPQNHIIFDAIGGSYMKDYLPEAIAYISYASTCGMYARSAYKLKDECYMRLVDVINRRALSIDESVANKKYEHAKLTESITLRNEFIEECSVIRFRDTTGGRKALISKREMRQHMGKYRSTDVLDPCAMRMLPILKYENGTELTETAIANQSNENVNEKLYVDIYDDSTWY